MRLRIVFWWSGSVHPTITTTTDWVVHSTLKGLPVSAAVVVGGGRVVVLQNYCEYVTNEISLQKLLSSVIVLPFKDFRPPEEWLTDCLSACRAGWVPVSRPLGGVIFQRIV